MIKSIVDLFLLLLDSGKLLKAPIKWLYFASGVLCFLPALVAIYFFYKKFDLLQNFLSRSYWGNFVTIFMIFLFIYALIILGVLGFRFWQNRMRNLDAVAETGSRTIAIPLLADYFQTACDRNAMFMVATPIAGVILGIIACILTDGLGFYSDINAFYIIGGGCAIVILAMFFSYLYLLSTHYVAEKMRLSAQIGNDVHKLTFEGDRKAPREADKKEFDICLPKLNKKEIKIGIIAIVIAFIFSLSTVVFQALIVYKANNTIIGEEVGELTMKYAIKRDHNFSEAYALGQNVYNKARAKNLTSECEKITYGRLYKYKCNYIENDEFEKSTRSRAENNFGFQYKKPLEKQINDLVNKWKEYTETHDISNYITIEPHTRNSDGTAGFYFDIIEPKGKCRGGSILFNAGDGFKFNKSLSEIREYHKGARYRLIQGWEYVSASYWNNHSIKVTILSITTPSGETIHHDDLKKVPSSVIKYIKEPNMENETAMIQSEIDKDYPDPNVFIKNYLKDEQKKLDPECFNILNKISAV